MILFFFLLSLQKQPENPCKKVYLDEFRQCLKDFDNRDECENYAMNQAMVCVIDDDDG